MQQTSFIDFLITNDKVIFSSFPFSVKGKVLLSLYLLLKNQKSKPPK